jgi:hypothetical protein
MNADGHGLGGSDSGLDSPSPSSPTSKGTLTSEDLGPGPLIGVHQCQSVVELRCCRFGHLTDAIA